MEKVDLTPLIELFDDFFTSVYKPQINSLLMVYPSKRSLNIDYADLEKFDIELADRLIKEPDNVIAAAAEAIKQMNLSLPDKEMEFTPHIRFFNLPSEDILIEQLGSKNLNELVSFKGVVTKRTDIMHKIKIVHYMCEVCDHSFKWPVGKDFVPQKRCPSCKKFALKQMDEESKFSDVQRAEVQELLERVRGGTPAAHIELLMEDDLINQLVPGENVEITGILRMKPPVKSRSRQDMLYSHYLEVLHIKSLKRDFEEIEITKEDEKKIKEFSKDPNVEKKLVESIAPAIYGYNEVKRAIALQLFGGTKGKLIKGGLPIRDDIHLLLIGDPGVAKCTDGDANVLLADGSVQKIRDIVENVLREKGGTAVEDGVYATSNHTILSLGLDGKMEENKATYFWKLQAPPYLYEIETYLGKTIKVTAEHPFFISANGHVASRTAKEIKKGEFIATPRFIPIRGRQQPLPIPVQSKTSANRFFLPRTLTPDFARLLGYLTSDGYARKTTSYEIGLMNNDTSLLNDFVRILRTFSLKPKIKTNKRNGVRTVFVFSVELGRVLEALGMMKTAFHKTIPLSIMRSPNNVVKEFIKSYFDCEASVGKSGITVVSASRNMLEEIQLLLLRFGIVSQLHQIRCRLPNAKDHKITVYHRLYIRGENAARYSDLISSTSSSNIRKLASLKRKFNSDMDVVPNLRSILKETRESLGLSQFQCGIPRSTYKHFEQGNRNPDRSMLAAIVSAFKKAGKSPNIRLLELLSKSHIFWDRIKSIKKVKPKEKWVYDLQVDPTHNFVANSMIVHNTRFVQSVCDIAPKSIYVSGKSVSGVGLTVSAEKDELGEGGWTLKAGALVLASGGIAGIDEFDKIDDEDRGALHEVMESQSVSMAKAGIVAKFRAKTAIIAAANPKYGRFDQTKNLAEQFDIPPSLLSRFDLIFPIVDVLDEEKDSKLADHILHSHKNGGKREWETQSEEEKETIDRTFLKKYIAYAKRHIFPQLTDEATEKIKAYYVNLRKMGKDIGSVTITPRYLEGLVRLAEANAKMRLSQRVEGRDADAAIELMHYVLSKVMTDKETGKIDVDTVVTGRPRSQVQKIETILDIIKSLAKQYDTVEIKKVIEEAATYDIDEQTVRRIIAELLRKGDIYEKEHGHVRPVEQERS